MENWHEPADEIEATDPDDEILYRCWSCAQIMEPQHYGHLCYECEALDAEHQGAASAARRQELTTTLLDIAATAAGRAA